MISRVGIELEYMIVDRDTLDVKPIVDKLLAAQAGELRDREPARAPAGWLDWVSRIAGLLGLAGVIAHSRQA